MERHTLAHGLTDMQEEAARRLACGMRPSQVADGLGLNRSTLSAWRGQEPFKARIRQLHDEVRERTQSLATETASWALDEARAAIRDCDDPAKRGRLAIDLYRITAGQTGLPETTRHETVDLAAVIDYLDRLTDAELEAVEGAVSGE